MDEIVINNEVETELLENEFLYIDNQSIGKEETPNTSLTYDNLPLSEDDTQDMFSSYNENEDITLAPEELNEDVPLAPDAISEELYMETETKTDNVPSVTLQTEGTQSEKQGANLEYNIDDVYTLLSDGVTVKLQSESETESLQNESEITISDIYSKLEETRLLESEALLQINNNVVKASNNDNIVGFISISLLASLLGGIVAIGFLKGLK